MNPNESRAALLLCGGASRRMGFPKAMLKLGDTTFLETVVRSVATICPTVVLVAAPVQALPSFGPKIRIVRDAVAHQGPLAAIAVGLAELPVESRQVFVTGTDTPLLRPSLVEGMFRMAEGHDLAIATDGQRQQPLLAVYEVAFARRKIRELMAEGRFRAQALSENANAFEMTPEMLRRFDPDLASLRNINEPRDYRALLAELGFEEPEDFRDSHFES